MTNTSVSSVSSDSNFSKQFKFCVDALVQNEDLMKSRERIKEEQTKLKNVREQLKSVKRLPVGNFFKAGATRLGKTLLEVHEGNLLKHTLEEKEKLFKQKETMNEAIIEAKKVMERNVPFDKLTVKDMKLLLAPLKRPGDKWPTKRKDLIELYPKVKDRLPLTFNIDPLINIDNSTGIGNDFIKNDNNINHDSDTDSDTDTDNNKNFLGV